MPVTRARFRCLLVAVAQIGADDAEEQEYDDHEDRMVGEGADDSPRNNQNAPEHEQDGEHQEDRLLVLVQGHRDDARDDPAQQNPRLQVHRAGPAIHQEGPPDDHSNLTRPLQLAKHRLGDTKDDQPGENQDDAPAKNVFTGILHREPVALGAARDVVLPGGHRLLVADQVHVGEFISRIATRQWSSRNQQSKGKQETSKQNVELGHSDLNFLSTVVECRSCGLKPRFFTNAAMPHTFLLRAESTSTHALLFQVRASK